MGKQRKKWGELSPDYQRRLTRNGISRTAYESGASLAKARGHAATPEKPERAASAPDRYARYIEDNADKYPNLGKTFPAFVYQTDEDDITMAVHGGWTKKAKTTIAHHWNAIRKHLTNKGEFRELIAPFERSWVGGTNGIPRYKLETRQEVIDRYLHRTEGTHFDTLYQANDDAA